MAGRNADSADWEGQWKLSKGFKFQKRRTKNTKKCSFRIADTVDESAESSKCLFASDILNA